MKQLILSKIQNLAPLPQSVTDIMKLKNSDDPSNEKLLRIIEADPMLITNILKSANSSMYGLSGKIKTTSDALKML